MSKPARLLLTCSLLLAAFQTPAMSQEFLFRFGTGAAASTAADCTAPWGATVADGTSVDAFASDSVPFGNTCDTVKETRTCSNGVLSGSYTFQSCSPNPAANCTTPWSAPVAHGSGVNAFQTASVPFGNTCNSENRNCFNGTLSGSFANQACATDPAANCSAQTVSWSSCSGAIAAGPHGAALTASNTANGYTGTGNFTCNNGAWQNTGGACAAAQQAPQVTCNLNTDQQALGPNTRIASTTSNLNRAQCAAYCVANGAQPGDICWMTGNGGYDNGFGCGLYRGGSTRPMAPSMSIYNSAGICQ